MHSHNDLLCVRRDLLCAVLCSKQRENGWLRVLVIKVMLSYWKGWQACWEMPAIIPDGTTLRWRVWNRRSCPNGHPVKKMLFGKIIYSWDSLDENEGGVRIPDKKPLSRSRCKNESLEGETDMVWVASQEALMTKAHGAREGGRLCDKKGRW